MTCLTAYTFVCLSQQVPDTAAGEEGAALHASAVSTRGTPVQRQ